MIVCEKENNNEKNGKEIHFFFEKRESNEQTQKFSFVLP